MKSLHRVDQYTSQRSYNPLFVQSVSSIRFGEMHGSALVHGCIPRPYLRCSNLRFALVTRMVQQLWNEDAFRACPRWETGWMEQERRRAQTSPRGMIASPGENWIKRVTNMTRSYFCAQRIASFLSCRNSYLAVRCCSISSAFSGGPPMFRLHLLRRINLQRFKFLRLHVSKSIWDRYILCSAVN